MAMHTPSRVVGPTAIAILVAVTLGSVIFVSEPAEGGGATCRASAGGASEARVPKSHEEVQQLIFFAVLEGLYRDGVSTETATLLTTRGENGHGLQFFVYGCPICIPAVDAITVYAGRAPFPHRKMEQDTFGDGWSEDRRSLLADPDPRVRIEVVQAVVLGYMNDHLGSMRLTAAEQESWQGWLNSLREKGNALLEQYLETEGPMAEAYAGWKKCGACEGAAGAMQP